MINIALQFADQLETLILGVVSLGSVLYRVILGANSGTEPSEATGPYGAGVFGADPSRFSAHTPAREGTPIYACMTKTAGGIHMSII